MNIIKKKNTISTMIIINDIQYIIIMSKKNVCIYHKIIHVGKIPVFVALYFTIKEIDHLIDTPNIIITCLK